MNLNFELWLDILGPPGNALKPILVIAELFASKNIFLFSWFRNTKPDFLGVSFQVLWI